MNDFDLEELESHLYSQVYHANEEVEQNLDASPPENLQKTENTMKKPNRYFQSGPKSGGLKFPNKHVLGNQHNLKSNVYNENHTEGIYSKSYTRPQKQDKSIPQFLVLSTTQNPSVVCVAGSNKKKKKKAAKWRAKLKEKRQRQKRMPYLRNINLVDEKAKKDVQCEVITLSESDDESCVEIPHNWPVVSVTDSDDENKTIPKLESVKEELQCNENGTTQNLTDDVIFVEQVNVPVEVINLDEESESNIQKNTDDVNVHADVDADAATSSFLNYSPSKSRSISNAHQERKELLNTPDSASNDFMGNSGVELIHSNFNFSLHGKDFNNEKFLKPANPTERCETESSSSTTDNNTLNSLKTAVFNEIEFPKEDMFSEANLESFGNLITPARKRTPKDTIRASTPIEKVSQEQDQNVYSSDSSSESDFEEPVDKQRDLLKNHKNLPDLSPMHSTARCTAQQGQKKSKKISNLSSKYDLINTFTPDLVSKKTKLKKRKSISSSDPISGSSELNSKKKGKNKKRKTDISENSTQVASTNVCHNVEKSSVDLVGSEKNEIENPILLVDRNEVPDNETKQKKRKSGHFLDDSSDSFYNNQSKKKTRAKKRSNVSGAESEDMLPNVELPAPPQTECVEEDQGKEVESTTEQTDTIKDPSPHETVDVKNDKNVDQNDELDLHSKPDVPITAENCSPTTQNCNAPPLNDVDVSVVKSKEAEAKTTETGESGQIIKEEHSTIIQKIEESVLQGLVVVDEIFDNENNSIILISDSESNLSELVEQHDIQLINLKEPESQNKDVSSVPVIKPNVNLADHTLEEVQRTMSNDPKLWVILDSDRMPTFSNSGGRRCNRCRERGHMAVRCPNKVEPKCCLCGGRGHFEPRCPNRICTQCGERSPYSMTYCKFCFQLRTHQCQICFMIGHATNACPDLWRRYHLTTAEGPLKSHDGPVLKSKNKLWCSGCARPGHLEYACLFYQSVYPPSDPTIKSYENVYENSAGPQPRAPEIGQPLIYYGMNQHNGMYHSLPFVQPNCPVVYSQSNSYPTNPNTNSEFRPTYPEDRGFRGDQGNTSLRNEPVHDPLHNRQGGDGFFFKDNLPDFISLDSPPPNMNFTVQPEAGYLNGNESVESSETSTLTTNRLARENRQNCSIFFSSPTESILGLLNRELTGLIKMSYHIKNVVRTLKRQTFERPPVDKTKKYYKTLNMVLFGIYKLDDGEKHLVKLKNFRVKPKTKLSQQGREDLYRSYCYIFGFKKHGGVDYNKLLRRL